MQITHGFTSPDGPCALTIGNFDGLHLGHLAMLERLKAEATARKLPTCVLTFEPHPREFFSPAQAPARLTSLREKAELLQVSGLDRLHVFRFNQAFAALSPHAFIDRALVKTLGARWVLVGDDFRFGAKRAGDFALLKAAGEEQGFVAEFLPTVTVEGVRSSSTAVREALAEGDMDKAARLLGRPYSITGRLFHGNKLGRSIGFPTANIQLRHNRPPLSGIYVVEVWGIASTPLRGVASLGVRPTVHVNGRPTLEAFIFDLDRDLYGQRLRVDFLKKLRDEEKYPDLPSLVAQIKLDVTDAKSFFATRHG
ncbi:MAG TPA: bifunctional riboflavin kinase/FAD synthetase [Thiobacillaceae bacterium]|nr:bifunctional riboflavin kinase/FAD synthetase [Thiobacillaceae bacterium]